MRLIFARPWKSITGPVSDQEVADFVVLSGPNGSGKSNLLEAIAQGAVVIEGISQSPPQAQPIRLFVLSQLVAAAEAPQAHDAYRDRWVQLQQHIANQVAAATRQQPPLLPASDELENYLRSNVLSSRLVTESALRRMLEQSGKRLVDFTVDDYRIHGPLLIGIRDPFALTVSELFLTYHQRKNQNKFLQWLLETGSDTTAVPLGDDQFVARYGPPPWDLVNETLALVGLEYRFQAPEGHGENLTYEPRLEHLETGASVTMGELSSGEKTLAAVAMSLYAGSRLGEAIELPQVLLLDEADASLHPSMVQSLLRVADDIFCKRYGVKVLMTTHSPSTVAMAPEESLYVMRRMGQPRLRGATRDEALHSLTVGVPTLSVRMENRRQVFTESEYDATCFHHLFALLGHRLETEVSLEFIASGTGHSGGAEAVKHSVTNLRAAGNSSVWGVVDRDRRQGAPSGIVYVGGRHSLENLVLDPLPVGALLVREGILTPSQMGLPAALRHFELGEEHAQRVADFIVSRVQRLGDDLEPLTPSYLGGFSVALARFYLDAQGHALEARLKEVFPPLNAYGNALKARVIDRAIRDVPHYCPKDVVVLFRRIMDG